MSSIPPFMDPQKNKSIVILGLHELIEHVVDAQLVVSGTYKQLHIDILGCIVKIVLGNSGSQGNFYGIKAGSRDKVWGPFTGFTWIILLHAKDISMLLI